MRRRGLGQIEHTENVGLEGAPQLLLGDVADVLIRMLLAGIVDEDVESAKLIDRLPDSALTELLVANVAGDRDRAATLLLDNLFCLRRVVVLAQINDRHISALTRKQG